MNVLEKDLEDLIWELIERGDIGMLQRRGLFLDSYAQYFRQLNFGSYGIADLVGVSAFKRDKNTYEISVSIIELKKRQANHEML